MTNSFLPILDELEIKAGDLVFLHVSYSRIQDYVNSPQQLIDILLERIGQTGTLFMPRYAWHLLSNERPWKGYELYLRTLPTMDLRYTEANIGLIPEVFRTEYTTEVSISHFWPIAAIGPKAREILSGQQDVAHAYSSEASFSKLVDANARILGLGVTLNTSSLAPVVDYRVGNKIFTDPVAGRVIDLSGRLHHTRTSTMRAEAVRNYSPSNVMIGDFKPQTAFPYLEINRNVFFSYHVQDFLKSAQILWSHREQRDGCPWMKK